MKYINEDKINDLLHNSINTADDKIDKILEKSKSLQRLTLEESAALLSISDPEKINKLLKTASWVKNEIYGKRIVLFAPLYISNICKNACLYCAFKADNKEVHRKALTVDEIKSQVEWLLKRGHKRLLIVAGEAPPTGQKLIDYYVDSINAVYAVKVGKNYIRRANVNLAPLSVEEFRKLKQARIGTYQIFQETYHDATYKRVHPIGPKADPDNRLDAVDRAMTAGIDDVGIGVLYGLYDYKFDTLAMLSHVEHLEAKFNVGPHTISIPRLEPALGVNFINNNNYNITDDDFKKIVAVLRISVPYTGIILSTRETAKMRDELFSLGVSQVSAESKTSPGGYSHDEKLDDEAQFILSDSRSIDEIIGSLLKKSLIPSFCTACYRSHRTGEAFMNLAKPGTIKGKCQINAMITLKEYLDDFASDPVKKDGYKLLNDVKSKLSKSDLAKLSKFFEDIENGIRDEYV